MNKKLYILSILILSLIGSYLVFTNTDAASNVSSYLWVITNSLVVVFILGILFNLGSIIVFAIKKRGYEKKRLNFTGYLIMGLICSLFLMNKARDFAIQEQNTDYWWSDYEQNRTYTSEIIEEPIVIDIMNVDTSSWDRKNIGNYSIMLPNDWYLNKASNEEENVYTFGAGIQLYLTVRVIPLSEYNAHINTIENLDRDIVKETANVNRKSYSRITVKNTCYGDMCYLGFKNWYVESGSDMIILSEPESLGFTPDEATYATILDSIKPIR